MSWSSSALGRAMPWGVRIGAVLLVLGLHLGMWRPVRPFVVQYAAQPFLATVAAPEHLDLVWGGKGVRATVADGRALTYKSPAGFQFLLPALFLAAFFPRRVLWVRLWGAHLVAGAFTLLLLAIGARGSGVAASGYQFWTATGIDVFSLLVPLWMWQRARRGGFLPGERAPKADTV